MEDKRISLEEAKAYILKIYTSQLRTIIRSIFSGVYNITFFFSFF